MSNIAVIGDPDTALGFRLAGVTNIFETKQTQVKETFERVLSQNFDIILITEKLAEFIRKELEKFYEQSTPIIVQIPDKEGTSGYAKTRVREIIRRAVGVDITAKRGE